jgi:CheY-like chemotaxis protein
MSAPSGCSVLIVEDDPELREMMVQMLALEGFEPCPATDGLDALEKLRAPGPHPRLILLDMMMPRMDGWEFCRARALDPVMKTIPLVVLSAAPREHVNVDAAAFLTKPFDYETLLRAIRAHC